MELVGLPGERDGYNKGSFGAVEVPELLFTRQLPYALVES